LGVKLLPSVSQLVGRIGEFEFEGTAELRLGIDASNIRTGGGLTHLIEFLEAAQPQEHDITQVVLWAGQQTLKELPERPWFKGIHEPMLDGPLPIRLYWQSRKLSYLAKHSCDVLFVPGGNYTGLFRPFVTMSQNLLPFEAIEMGRYGCSLMRMKFLILRLTQSKSFRNANGIIFLNEYSRLRVMECIKSVNGCWAIIPHGVNKRFHLEPRMQKPIEIYTEKHPFKFLYVSIIDVYKHQWHVAKAVAQLKEEGLPVELHFIGPAYPPALLRLRKLIKQVDPGENFIYYLGVVPYHELVSHYHQADIFVFASSCENMPNILLEAMASGLPIACSERGPMRQILGDAGMYFNPEQPEDIANALRSFIENPVLRTDNAWLGYQRAQSYSWERCARETLSFLANIPHKLVGRGI
jgi:glycosyltransferase involved in cell wall biosynthesis